MKKTPSALDYDVLIKESTFLHAVLQSIEDGIIACDADGNITLFNSAASRLHNMSEKSMPVYELADYYGWYYADGKTKMTVDDMPLTKILKGESVEDMEMVISSQDGQQHSVLINGQILRDSSDVVMGAVIALHNITEKKEAEKKVLQTNEQLVTARNIANFGYWEWDRLTDEIICTDRFRELFSVAETEHLTYNLFLSRMHPDDRIRVEKNVKHAIESGTSFENFYRVTGKVNGSSNSSSNGNSNGSSLDRDQLSESDYQHLHGIGRSIKDEAGQVVKMVGVAIDVTEATRASQHLEEARARFSIAFKSATVGMAIVSTGGLWLELNDALCQSFGYVASDLVGQSFFKVTHPDDMEQDSRVLKKLLEEGVDNIHFEKRYIRSDDSIMHALVDVKSLRLEGIQDYFICNIIDITDKVRLEEERLKSETKLKAIFCAQPSAVIYTDEHGRIIESNDSVLDVFGYTPEELVGRNIWVLYDSAVKHQDFVELIEEDVSFAAVQVICIDKKGRVLNCDLTGCSVVIEDVKSHIWVFQDVTEHVEAKEDIATLNTQLVNSREEERKRIAREIHDQSIQDLIVLKYGLSNFQRQLDSYDIDNMQAALENLRDNTINAIKHLREVVNGLRPTALEEFGFEAAVEDLIVTLTKNHGTAMPEVKLQVDESAELLPSPQLICLFRTVQEGFNNILRHANSSLVFISLKILGTEALLVIEDNGGGFDLPIELESLKKEQHLGLAGIEERVRLLEGQFSLRSQVGLGTEISVTLPIK